MTLGDASSAAKKSVRFGCGLVMDDRPPLYLDATSIDDSFLVTLLQSSAWCPFSVFANTRPVPLSSSISGISIWIPQKSAIVMSE